MSGFQTWCIYWWFQNFRSTYPSIPQFARMFQINQHLHHHIYWYLLHHLQDLQTFDNSQELDISSVTLHVPYGFFFRDCHRCWKICCFFKKRSHCRTVDICKLLLQSLLSLVTCSPFVHSFTLCMRSENNSIWWYSSCKRLPKHQLCFVSSFFLFGTTCHVELNR